MHVLRSGERGKAKVSIRDYRWKKRDENRAEKEIERLEGWFGVALGRARRKGRMEKDGVEEEREESTESGGARPLTHDSNDTRTYKSRCAPRSARSSPYITMSYGCKPFKHRITRFTYCL